MYVSIGGPIFLIAVGAILRYATDFYISSVDMDTVGLILMIAGVLMLVLSFAVALFNSNNGPGSGGRPPSNQPPPPR